MSLKKNRTKESYYVKNTGVDLETPCVYVWASESRYVFTEERRLLDNLGIVLVTAGLYLCNASPTPTRMVYGAILRLASTGISAAIE